MAGEATSAPIGGGCARPTVSIWSWGGKEGGRRGSYVNDMERQGSGGDFGQYENMMTCMWVQCCLEHIKWYILGENIIT